MNRNRMLVLATLAIILSGAVAFLAYRMLKNRLSPRAETVQIAVALEKLTLGTRITDQQVRLVSWPVSAPLEGSFSNLTDVIGRGVVVPMAPNEPILEAKLAPTGVGAGLTTAIPEGMRALSVKVDDVTGVAGFVLPGTRVDVIAVGTPESGGKESEEVSKVFLENIEVLAAGQNVERDPQGKPVKNVQVVTLLLTPEDTQKLALATVGSKIRLSLRNPMDLEQANPIASRQSLIYGGPTSYGGVDPAPAPKPRVIRSVRRAAPKPVVVQPPSPPPVVKFEVEMIKGDKRETLTFERKP